MISSGKKKKVLNVKYLLNSLILNFYAKDIFHFSCFSQYPLFSCFGSSLQQLILYGCSSHVQRFAFAQIGISYFVYFHLSIKKKKISFRHKFSLSNVQLENVFHITSDHADAINKRKTTARKHGYLSSNF